jgi:Transposase DDE domain
VVSPVQRLRLRRSKKNSVVLLAPNSPAPRLAASDLPLAAHSPLAVSHLEVCCGADPFADILPTGALGLLTCFASRIGFFEPFAQHFQLPMHCRDYTSLQKLQALICSLAVGCEWTKDINHKLRPYPVAAQLLGLPQFPEQSCINRFLHQLGAPQQQQLECISEQLLQRFGLWRQSARVDLDIDSTGLMVYGRHYEGAQKGYFPRQRGRRGYRLTVASTRHPAGSEILSVCFDPANVAANGRFWDCLYQAAEVLGSLDRVGLILADAACGSGPDVQELLELGPAFIVKGISDKTAIKFAAQVQPAQWEPLDLFTRVCELGPRHITKCVHPVRVVLVELLTKRRDRPFYSHLYTNLSSHQADAETVFHRYNQRQCIEALIKTAKYGLSIKHLRTRSYEPIENFLHVAAITFNLLAWFRHYLLAQVDLQDLGLCELTQTLMDIPAKCSFRDDQLELRFPARHPLTPALSRLSSAAIPVI